MTYIIDNITDRYIQLRDKNNLTLELPITMFDKFSIRLDDTIELEIKIPYDVSRQRRMDINEHHAEEARNGDI